MNTKQFARILDSRLEKISNVLSAKAGEYSSDIDRLHNFKVAAQLEVEPITPERALVGMWRKHLVSVLDMVDGLDRGKLPSEAMIDEKIGDTINYGILLEALFRERHQYKADAYDHLVKVTAQPQHDKE